MALAVSQRDPLLAAGASLLGLSAMETALQRTVECTPIRHAMDCVALGLFCWIACVTVAALGIATAVVPQPSRSVGSIPGLLMLSALFFMLRRGRRDGWDRDSAIVASICAPFLVPLPWSFAAVLTLSAAAAAYLSWHGWVLIGPVTTRLLRGGRR